MSHQPRLSRGVTIVRRQIGSDEVFYLVRSPRTGSFLRVGEVEATVLRLMDGQRTLEGISTALDEVHNYEVPVSAIDSFLRTLTASGIVESSTFDPVAFREEWETQQRARKKTLGRLAGSLALIKIKLLNPRRLFDYLAGPLAFFWTPAFVFWSMVLMVAGAWMGIVYLEEIFASTAEFFREMTKSAGSFATHAAIFYAVFFVVVAIHEMAHGMTCTHFGGKVTDMGFILFYMQIPGFYCDITDAYGFEKRSHRLWVTVAGGYTGLILAAIGVFMWWMTNPGDILNSASIALMIVGGPPLLIFNWNPLIRYDGYYILMDLLEAPNLASNSYKYLGYLFKSKVLRVPVERMEVPQRLRRAYVIYGLASIAFLAPFMLFIPFIVYYIFSGMLGPELGVLAAVFLGFRVLQKPLGKVLTSFRYAWLTHRATLVGGSAGRARATVLGIGAAIGVLLLVFGPRFAVRVEALGVLEPLERIEVRAETPGFVTVGVAETVPREGERVSAGGPLVRLENRDLEAELRTARKERAVLELDTARLEAMGDPAAAAIRRAAVKAVSGREEVLTEQIERLSLRSPIDGVVLTPRLEQKAGVYLKPGDVWCVVGRTDQLRVRVRLTERELGEIGKGSEAELRSIPMPWMTFKGIVDRMPPGLVKPANEPLMTAGVTPRVTLDPKEVKGSLMVNVRVANDERLLLPGMTVRVRIYGERLTLAGHTARWLRRLFKGKVWW